MVKLNELFVSYEIALTLKEKGFEEETFGFYWKDTYQLVIDFGKHRGMHLSAPLHQQCVDWLRINHRIEVSSPCKKDKDLGVFYGGYVKKYDDDFGKSYGSNFRDYYEAYNHGIEEALKLI